MIVANVWKVHRIDFVVKMNVVSMSSVEDVLTEMVGNRFEIQSEKWGDKLEILLTVVITLSIHSLLGTIIYIVTNENDDFAAYYAIGIIGWIVSGLVISQV